MVALKTKHADPDEQRALQSKHTRPILVSLLKAKAFSADASQNAQSISIEIGHGRITSR